MVDLKLAVMKKERSFVERLFHFDVEMRCQDSVSNHDFSFIDFD